MPQPDLLQLADQCVKCGFCLPHCPTFRLYRDEAESPRGRISLIQGLLAGDIPDSARLGAHLDHCLECRACETVCPSLVQFAELMDGARAVRAAKAPRWRRSIRRLVLDLLSGSRAPGYLRALSRLYVISGAARAARRLGLLRRPSLAVLDGLAARLRPSARRVEPPDAALPARADTGSAAVRPYGLFVGCVGRGLQPDLAGAAMTVLRRLRIPVLMPQEQVCCGAMHRHNGEPDAADALLSRNRAAFAGCTAVGLASACTAELKSALDAVEICRLLVDADWPGDVQPAPLHALVAVHEPCSHRNVLRDTAAIYRLLERIPSLRVVPLPGNDACCGAAGTYLLQHPETALTLAADKVAALSRLQPEFLVTTNSGCAAHLAARAQAAGLAVDVLHPVELLARQLHYSGH